MYVSYGITAVLSGLLSDKLRTYEGTKIFISHKFVTERSIKIILVLKFPLVLFAADQNLCTPL